MGLLRSFLFFAVLGLMLGGFPLKGYPAPKSSKKPYYVGSHKCKTCHAATYKSWKKTKMANTFKLLKPGKRVKAKRKAGLNPRHDYSSDPKCLKCHTTGYKEVGGYGHPKKSRRSPMTSVSCEACHGPGSKYVKIMKKVKNTKKAPAGTEKALVSAGLILPGRTDVTKKGKKLDTSKLVCLKCHNKESPAFKGFDPVERLGEKSAMHKRIKLKYIKHDYPLKIKNRYLKKKK